MTWPKYSNGIPAGVPGALVGILLGTIIGISHRYSDNRMTKMLQKEYVNSNKLEIECKDLGKDGKLETILQYDGKSYLFKLDTSGKPYCEIYKVEPAKVVEVPNSERRDEK